MQYGYFDEKNKEYLITKPNTPAPWGTTSAHRSTAPSFPAMQEGTAL
ncbi:hypothetical protein [Fontibacillus phaseoli]|nr:hypothetical protein [Fontibacillus phaseoli]